MATLEDWMKDLRCNKMPLISYGAQNPKMASLLPGQKPMNKNKKFFKFVKKVSPDSKGENVPSGICWHLWNYTAIHF